MKLATRKLAWVSGPGASCGQRLMLNFDGDLEPGALSDHAGARSKSHFQTFGSASGGAGPCAVDIATEPVPAFRSNKSVRYKNRDCLSAEEEFSDRLLLRNVAEGDRAARHILFARHRGRVFRLIRRMVPNPGLANDIVGQVFLDVWRSANRLEDGAKVSAWMVWIGRVKVINCQHGCASDGVDRNHIADADETPEGMLERTEMLDILRSCVDRLSPAHREIIELACCQERSVGEVSEIIGVSYAAAKSRLFYARKRLARILVDAAVRPRTEKQRGKSGFPDRTSKHRQSGCSIRNRGMPVSVLQESAS
jgi:RNA polymerase sigma-70 factor, ECF subfamily